MDLCRKLGGHVDKESLLAEIGDKKPDTQDRDGRLRNLLKKANLKRWVGTLDFRGNEAEVHMDGEGNFSSKKFNSIDFARFVNNSCNLSCIVFILFIGFFYANSPLICAHFPSRRYCILRPCLFFRHFAYFCCFFHFLFQNED